MNKYSQFQKTSSMNKSKKRLINGFIMKYVVDSESHRNES
jgi:hypothetical protein